jgi:hypothetical protein
MLNILYKELSMSKPKIISIILVALLLIVGAVSAFAAGSNNTMWLQTGKAEDA